MSDERVRFSSRNLAHTQAVEFQDEIITALIKNEKLPENLPGTNLRPLALQFCWGKLPSEVVFVRLDDLERLYPDDEVISRLAEIVRECRLISSVTKSSLLDLVAQRQTQSLLRVVHSTGALKGMKDSQVLHIVKDGKRTTKHLESMDNAAIFLYDEKNRFVLPHDPLF